MVGARERPNYLQRRLRSARNSKTQADWVSAIGKALGFNVADSDALTSEETEEFEGRFWAAVKSNVGNSRSWQKEREQAGILLRRIAVDIGTQAVVFVDASSRQLNAIRLPCGAVLEGALEVWDAIGGEESSDIAMGTADLNDGLLLERNHMSADEAGVVVHGADVYELTTWGSFDAAVQKLLGKQP